MSTESGSPAVGVGYTITSPLVGTLAALLSVSSWSKLFPSPPPLLQLLALLSSDVEGYANFDRYNSHRTGFPLYLSVWGVPRDVSESIAEIVRYAVACVEVAVMVNLAVAKTQDHRMLATASAVVVHLLLLASMLLVGAEFESSSHEQTIEELVEQVSPVLALESMMIQMIAGTLVLLGLRVSVPYEVRDYKPGMPRPKATVNLPKPPGRDAYVSNLPRKRMNATNGVLGLGLLLGFTLMATCHGLDTASGQLTPLPLRACDGILCGRTRQQNGGLSNCGACPRGHRAADGPESICQKCTTPLSTYSIMYLVIQVLTSLLWQVYGSTGKNSSTRSVNLWVIVSQIIEIVASCVIASLFINPVGELRMFGCGVRSIDDWYPVFRNPTAPCSPMDCVNEGVYPLLTWVIFTDAINIVLAIVLRLPLTRLRKATAAGVDSVFSSLYILPAHAFISTFFGGLIFYLFPYILTMGGTVMVSLWLCNSDASVRKRLIDPISATILLSGYAVTSTGICGLMFFFDAGEVLTWTLPICVPLLMIVIFTLTSRATTPEQVVARLRGLGRRRT